MHIVYVLCHVILNVYHSACSSHSPHLAGFAENYPDDGEMRKLW